MYTMVPCCCRTPCCPWPKSGGVLGKMIWLCGCTRKRRENSEPVLLSKDGQSLAPFPLIGPILGPDCLGAMTIAGVIIITCVGFLGVIAPSLPAVSERGFCMIFTQGLAMTWHHWKAQRMNFAIDKVQITFYRAFSCFLGSWNCSIMFLSRRSANFLCHYMQKSRFGTVWWCAVFWQSLLQG